MDKMNECVIEWIKGDDTACVTMPNQTRLKGRIMKLSAEHEEVDYTLNQDGSICATIPSSWVKINPKRTVTEQGRKVMAENLAKNTRVIEP